MSKRKDRKITIRLTLADYILIRDVAIAQGDDMGPMLSRWLRQPLAVHRRAAKRKAANRDLKRAG